MAIRPVPQTEADVEAARALKDATRGPRPVNTIPAVDLGSGRAIFSFAGRPWIAEVPWREGVELHDLWLEIESYGDSIDRADIPKYRAALERVVELLWRCTKPTSKRRRFLHAIGFFRNPFRNATESDLGRLVGFFSKLRTRSSVRV